ncbi:hypothetical protein ACR73R_02790, partial [Bifidobacterium longum subsp. longum]|uniref:hypothetical protein n=1 Tax=Bifidobacterium longum TaxID=216816 RepID=UPI003DA5312B
RIFDAVERPTVFPATVFVSVASGHLTLLAVGQVLQRSLEPAQWEIRGGGKFHNHRKQSAVSAVFAMICHVHHVPLMNMFLELGVFSYRCGRGWADFPSCGLGNDC